MTFGGVFLGVIVGVVLLAVCSTILAVCACILAGRADGED